MLFIVFLQNIHTFNCRNEKKSLLKIPKKNNYFIHIGIFLTIFIQLLVYTVLGISHLLHLESVPIDVIFIDLLCALPIILVMEKFNKDKKE